MSCSSAIDWRVQRRALVIAGVACGLMAWWFHGDEGHFFLLVALAILLGAPVLVCLLAASLWCTLSGRRTWHASGVAINWLLATFIVLLGVFVSFVPGLLIGDWLLSRAMNWASQLAPKIDAYRTEHGHFPSDLREITDFSDAPRLARDELRYERTGEFYTLIYFTGLFSDWEWSSNDRTWRYNSS